ncbi:MULTISPECIES: 2-hydroxychromene-2-carboxylate isomerase [Paraburkholderia]|uniref:2-hydroxychromene-2-carboxylate isomerase n=1 Tax=Paraburkholderia TaxID=1822464 RepID=UPI000B48B80E|nr:disulfide bond formation protein DsbA [Burkholderia sp. Bk]
MTKNLDLYFDFISPFSYLAHIKLPELARQYGYTISYHPIDIPTAKIAAGNYGPSNREVQSKMKVLLADMHRWAARYDVPLTFPKGFKGERWNIGVLYADKKRDTEAYVTETYHRIWGLGINPSDEGQLGEVAEKMGWNVAEFLAFVSSPEGQTAFRKSCVEAHARGVFGAPIMMVGEEVWWGNDRLMFLEDFMRSH